MILLLIFHEVDLGKCTIPTFRWNAGKYLHSQECPTRILEINRLSITFSASTLYFHWGLNFVATMPKSTHPWEFAQNFKQYNYIILIRFHQLLMTFFAVGKRALEIIGTHLLSTLGQISIASSFVSFNSCCLCSLEPLSNTKNSNSPKYRAITSKWAILSLSIRRWKSDIKDDKAREMCKSEMRWKAKVKPLTLCRPHSVARISRAEFKRILRTAIDTYSIIKQEQTTCKPFYIDYSANVSRTTTTTPLTANKKRENRFNCY